MIRVVTIGLGSLVLAYFHPLPLLPRHAIPVVPNHRGLPVPITLGIWCAAVAALAPAGGLLSRLTGDPGLPADAWLLIGIAVVFAAGFADDRAHEHIRGIRRHFRLLARGRVTTGILKLLAAGSAGLLLTIATHGSAARVVLGSAVIAGMANLVNLFDVAPGRALKFGALVAIALASVRRSDLALAACGATIGLLPSDVRERGMLGDGGANALGFVLGVELYDRLSVTGLAVALAVILALHLVAETVTLSRVIRATPPLRWFDDLWRARSEGLER